ncbi:hypothetical protein [Actinotalea sp. Marseille-Q4924]|uniref:hypothetical protein n=1 Tax=Actinotalea sp. Marseille-Q4924 TaxID=2866571 RepID=UPI001CE43DCB|nr:hypothetical protein [Actinotalea sp. Marseille-Q4924]
MRTRPIRRAAIVFLAATAWGAAVSVRDDVVGEPLGLRAPGSAVTHLVTGWGTGLAAPWPMAALVLVDAVREASGRPAGRWSRLVGAAVFAGTAVEPVTWGRRARSPLVASAVVVNLVAGTLLLRAGRGATARALLAPGPGTAWGHEPTR